jgi:hypothetical protein
MKADREGLLKQGEKLPVALEALRRTYANFSLANGSASSTAFGEGCIKCAVQR